MTNERKRKIMSDIMFYYGPSCITTFAFGHMLELCAGTGAENQGKMLLRMYCTECNPCAEPGRKPDAVYPTDFSADLTNAEMRIAMEKILGIMEEESFTASHLTLTEGIYLKIKDLGMDIFGERSEKKERTRCDICLEEGPRHPEAKCCFNCERADTDCGVMHNCGKDCCGWVARKDAITPENYDRNQAKIIRKTCYDRYVMLWMTDHGYSVADIASIALEWQDHKDVFFDTYLRSVLMERKRQAPASYWEFINASSGDESYRNMELMRCLLTDDEFFQYMEDTERIKVLRKSDTDRMQYITWHSNHLGDLSDGHGKPVDEKDLPAELQWAYRELTHLEYSYGPVYLVKTEKGYGVAYSLEYDHLGRFKELPHGERFSLACKDAATIAFSREMRDPCIEIVVIEDVEGAGIEQHEIDVIAHFRPDYLRDHTKEVFSEVAEELEHLYYNGLSCT